jgi:probable F420-dependent oxidoreductase
VIVRFGISLFTSDRGIRPADAAKAAEEHGFDSFWVPEHTHIPANRATPHPGTGSAELPDDRYMRTLDPWVALATTSQATSTIRLGTSVALPLEHDPIALAKTIATLDHLSGGRVILGAGFGWNAEEMADHGVPPGKRRRALREYIEAMRAIWTEETASYEGEFVRLPPSWSWPKPVQARLPVLLGVGAGGRTFAWIARNCDGWITTPGQADIAVHSTALRDAWQAAGREGEPVMVVLDHKPDREKMDVWRRAGVSEVMIGLPDRSRSEVLAYIERRAQLVRELEST